MFEFAAAYFFEEHGQLISWFKQMGVYGGVMGVAGKKEDAEKAWNPEPFRERVCRLREEGVHVSVVEGPTSMEKIKLGQPGRDAEIENFIRLLREMGKLGIPTLCYNWMPVFGWFRTRTDVPARGGAKATGFWLSDLEGKPPVEQDGISAHALWKNLEYFLKAVLPEAERAGVRLAVHPDDPPVSGLRGVARILTSAEAMDRVTRIVESPCNGITLCQGTFAAMGEDIPKQIKYFLQRKKLFFSHFRDVRGTAESFTETFHDEGQTDMYRCMKAYLAGDFDGCMRPDHVPAMSGEENAHPGYSALGNLFAVGYMKGLLEAARKEQDKTAGMQIEKD